MKNVVDWATEAGVKTLIFFAFSEENWKRSEDEVSFLMSLIRDMITNELKEAIEKNIRMKFIGDVSKFPKDIAEGIANAEEQSAKNTGINLVIAASYGGRQEIVRAVNRMIDEGKKNITAEDMNTHLDTAGLPDPDIIIRTSGEMRLSGFLPWQSVYSELFFTKTFWPDFSKEEFLNIIEEFGNRERRLGK